MVTLLNYSEKNTKKNKYWVVRFTSSPGRHRTKLKHQIDPNRKDDSYVINSPIIEKYERFLSPFPLENLRVHKDDLKTIRQIQKKKDEIHEPAKCSSKRINHRELIKAKSKKKGKRND